MKNIINKNKKLSYLRNKKYKVKGRNLIFSHSYRILNITLRFLKSYNWNQIR